MTITGRRFEGRVALVTGGTSGIGRATARRLHDEGAAVVIAGRNEEAGRDAVAALDPDRARFLATDVVDRDQVRALVDHTVERFGRLDVVVNAAGAIVVTPFARLRPEHWRRTIDVNLNATFEVCQAALAPLRATIASGRATGGAIVNIASLDAGRADPGMAAYCAAKAGVVNFTRSLALELAGEGIRANTVSPGAVDTPMTVATAGDADNAAAFRRAIPVGRFGRPEEIAAAVAFVASDEALFMTGADLVIDGGVTAATGHPDLLALFGLTR
jgi:meso-butanediol dehydrogenase / (S,S)-butanediol dehydrogenase / diacetyl reductase